MYHVMYHLHNIMQLVCRHMGYVEASDCRQLDTRTNKDTMANEEQDVSASGNWWTGAEDEDESERVEYDRW